MTVRTITIKAVGELGLTPAVSSLLTACVKMNSEHGREKGDFYIEDLHVTYSYAEHTVAHKGGRKKKSARESNIEEFNHSYPN